MRTSPQPTEVYSPRELALAAGVTEAEVRALLDGGRIGALTSSSGQRFIPHDEAVHAGRTLLAGLARPSAAAMFSNEPGSSRPVRAPFAVSTLAHAALVTMLVLATSIGLGRTTTLADERIDPQPLRLVYLALPGPGGGGGGGGLRQHLAPPKAKRKGHSTIDSPLPVRKPPELPEPVAVPKDPEPPKTPPEPLPPVEAPVAKAPADDRDRPGVLEQTTAQNDSRGAGTGGGVGTGTGTGIGEGDGSGIGDGSGGGTGGGPYRPGSGIEPPSLLREVKPDYTEQARQRGIEGDVVMEIVVRRDGTVGDVRVLEGLGYGLDERAVQAVRQWRFTPAHRKGAAVDVMVEVAMEFKIR